MPDRKSIDIIFVVIDVYTEHLGIMILSSVLKKAGHHVDIVAARENKVAARLKNNNFTILAYSAYSSDISYYLRLNHNIKKEFNVFSLFGGPHPTTYPELINEPGVDGICLGEGEYAFLELADNMRQDKPITNINNLWIKKDGRVSRSPQRPPIHNMDDLPFADRALFRNRPYKYAATSRGCPYRCSYCCERSRFRRRSVNNVIAELKQIKSEGGCDFLFFSDPVFDLSLPWIDEFCERYKAEINIPFYCHTRADLVTRQAVQKLKNANCRYISFGLETANDYLRNEILRKDLSKKQIMSAANIVKEAGIRLRTSVMLGLPFGTLDDDIETLRFNIQCRADYTDAHPLFVHRGLEICDFLNTSSCFRPPDLPKKYFFFYFETLHASEARRIKNLCRIFALVTGMPFLFPLTRLLINLPLQRLYLYINYAWEGFYQYCNLFYKYRGVKGFVSGMIKYARILKKPKN